MHNQISPCFLEDYVIHYNEVVDKNKAGGQSLIKITLSQKG